MPPHFKRGAHKQQGKRSKQNSGKRAPPKTSFTSNRTAETGDEPEELAPDEATQSDANLSNSEDEGGSSEDERLPPSTAYTNLLQALKPVSNPTERPTKRRRLEEQYSVVSSTPDTHDSILQAEAAQDVVDQMVLVEEADGDGTASEDSDSDDEEVMLHDPFEQHYMGVVEIGLDSAIASCSEKPKTAKTTIASALRKTTTLHDDQLNRSTSVKLNTQRQHIKTRLLGRGAGLLASLEPETSDFASEVFGYRDILSGNRSLKNAADHRNILALHALNHIFKTRDRVLKNNAKLGQENTVDLEYRDQGFTRPKVLVLLPTKQSCVRFIEALVQQSGPDQQENRSRFLDTFSQPQDESFQNKPDDFRELFGGNHEEDFRVGLKFTRKTIKYFSGFYNSDVILGSPLGLMRTITTGGGKKGGKKIQDSDFLSSIEVVIMDQTNAIEMQNWQHVDYVFSQLNQLPKESHGCDFARVRNWYLDGKAKYLRQTIILSDYLTPSLASLASNHLFNVAGRVKYTPTYPGSMTDLPPALPFTVTQSFLRFDSISPQSDSDSRFKFFTSTILPNLLRSTNKASNKGTLIFVPTYVDFVRLRNHFSTAAETTSLSFGTVSEYSSRGEVARARAHFLNGRHSVLLYSERAHHYFRYKLKGIRRLIFYGVSDNPVFWPELVDSLASNAQHDPEWSQSQRSKQGKGLVRAMFSRWDVMKLERIVGTDRVGRLVNEREGDVFDFE